MSPSTDYLFRYTNLESLRNILCTKSLTLFDFQKWPDKNDSYFMGLYKKDRELKSLLALCLTSSWEQYHLWKVFGSMKELDSAINTEPLLGLGSYDGSSPLARIAVSTKFKRSELECAIRNCDGCNGRDVKYMNLKELTGLNNDPENDPTRDLPFIKRKGFGGESEYRIIYESQSETVPMKAIPIWSSCIDKIILSYDLSTDAFKDIQGKLRSINGWESLDCEPSHLIESRKWKAAGDEIVEVARQKRKAQQK